MATLSNIQGASLVPDLAPALGTLVGAFGTKRERDAEAAALATQEEIQTQTGIATTTTGPAQQKAIARIISLDPATGKAIADLVKSGNTQAIEAAKQEAETGARQAAFVSSRPDFTSKQKALTDIGTEIIANGGDPSKIIELQNMNEADLNLALDRMKIMGADLKTVLAGPAGSADVQSAKILPGGLVQLVFKDGRVEVKPGTPENIALVEAAEERGTQLAIDRAGGKRGAVLEADIEKGGEAAASGLAGTEAIKQSTKAFEQLAGIRTSILNIDEAIQLIDEGAQTGPVLALLPSVRAASVKLDNVQKAMGLDVIGTTTFGALSKGELDLALSKALPTNLQPAALREWLVDKKVAQEKLSAYLESAATFLGTPGNTIPDFIELQKIQQESGAEEAVIEEASAVEVPTAVNPETGETLFFRNGTWQTQ